MTEDESYENSSDQGRRIGSWGVPGGAPPVEEEDIPDWLFEDPIFWIGRYHELEKSYMDLGQMMESYRQDNRGSNFMHRTNSEYRFEKSINRMRNAAGMFLSTVSMLYAISAIGLVDIPSILILTVAGALVTVFDAIDLPGLLAKITP